MPHSLELFLLLQKLPGYTAQDLYDTDATLVEDWIAYAQMQGVGPASGG